MHALGWTREEAVQYMLAHTAASESNTRGEVNQQFDNLVMSVLT